MGILKKILSPRYLFAFLVIAGGTMVTVLQSTPDQCFSTTDGDLSEQSTFGVYQGITQSGCGSNLALDYIIEQGTSVSWSGFEGAITGSVVVNSGATLEITGSANFESSLSNAGSLSVQPQSAPAAPAAPASDFYNITNISGHTSEGGTTATFKVALDATPKPPAPSAPSKSGSDFYKITNISGSNPSMSLISSLTPNLTLSFSYSSFSLCSLCCCSCSLCSRLLLFSSSCLRR